MEQANVNTTIYKRKAMIADIEIIKQSETEALLKTTTVMGNSDDEPEGSTDYWYPINKMGKCGAYQGQFAGKRDATDYIESVANNKNSQRLRTLIPQGYDYYYFTNIDVFHAYALDYSNGQYPNMANPYGPYLLWFGDGANSCYNCIPPVELDWYGKQSIPYIVEIQKPYGKECCFTNVDWTFTTSTNYYWLLHKLVISYGTINFGQGVIPF